MQPMPHGQPIGRKPMLNRTFSAPEMGIQGVIQARGDATWIHPVDPNLVNAIQLQAQVQQLQQQIMWQSMLQQQWLQAQAVQSASTVSPYLNIQIPPQYPNVILSPTSTTSCPSTPSDEDLCAAALRESAAFEEMLESTPPPKPVPFVEVPKRLAPSKEQLKRQSTPSIRRPPMSSPKAPAAFGRRALPPIDEGAAEVVENSNKWYSLRSGTNYMSWDRTA